MAGPIDSEAFLVEIIRYGCEELGTQYYGIFTAFKDIAPEMRRYNKYRGGKYPSYYVTPLNLNPSAYNPTDLRHAKRIRYEAD
jgi:hypothetical protein